MTGPGTNTYIIGGTGGYVVIDPGPDDHDIAVFHGFLVHVTPSLAVR